MIPKLALMNFKDLSTKLMDQKERSQLKTVIWSINLKMQREQLFSLTRIEPVLQPKWKMETRERINLLGKMRHLQHEMGVMKSHLEEEFEAKQEMKRQLSKAYADIQKIS